MEELPAVPDRRQSCYWEQDLRPSPSRLAMEEGLSWGGQEDPLDLAALIDYFFVEIVPLAGSGASLSRETITDLMGWARVVQDLACHPRMAPPLSLAHPPYPFPPHQAVYGLGLVFLDNVRLSSKQCLGVETRLRAARGTSERDRIAFRVALQQRKSAKRAILRAAYLHSQSQFKTQAQDLLLDGRADQEVDLGIEPSSDPLYPLMLQDHLPRVLDALATRSTGTLNRALADNPTLLTECVNYFRAQPHQQAHPMFPKLVTSSDLFRRRFRSSE